MKNITLLSSTLIAGVLFASSAAMAAPHGQHQQRLNIDVQKMEMRIDAGVKSGKLTPTEERQVRAELSKLGSSMKSALKDRKVTKTERTSLEGKEAALNKLIAKLSNNNTVVKKDTRHDGKWDQRDGEKRDQRDDGKRDQPNNVQQGHFKQDNGNDKAPFKPDNARQQQVPHAQH